MFTLDGMVTRPIHPQMRAFQEGMRQRHLKRADVCRALDISTQVYQNWMVRGIAIRELPRVARAIGADHEALAEGKFLPSEALESPQTADGREMGIAFELMSNEWKDRLREVLNDYVRFEYPKLAKYLGNTNQRARKNATRIVEAAKRINPCAPEPQ